MVEAKIKKFAEVCDLSNNMIARSSYIIKLLETVSSGLPEKKHNKLTTYMCKIVSKLNNSEPFGDVDKNYFIFPVNTSSLGIINEFSFVTNRLRVPVIKKNDPTHLSELSRLALKTNYNWISAISNKKSIQPEDFYLKLDLISTHPI